MGIGPAYYEVREVGTMRIVLVAFLGAFSALCFNLMACNAVGSDEDADVEQPEGDADEEVNTNDDSDEYTTPILESVEVVEEGFALSWSLPTSIHGVPAGGYDIYVDGADMETTYRTEMMIAVIGDLSAGSHCFNVEARWTQVAPSMFPDSVYPRSNEVCEEMPRGILSLRVDPSFDESSLPSEVRSWYGRMWTAIENPDNRPNSRELAESNDTYQYGRALNSFITALLLVLRVTGDPALLGELYELTEMMRAELRDWSILTYEGETYETDGYLNWLYWYDEGYRGTDVHEMDEAMAHGLVAAFTYAFMVNADVDRRYAESVEFWTDYLVNHFEAKWRARKRVPTGFPFLEKRLVHAYTQWTRYHWYMAYLTGDPDYRTEAERMAENIRDHFNIEGTVVDTPLGEAVVWCHGMPEIGGSCLGAQRSHYARQTVQGATDLWCEGLSPFREDGFMQRVATTVAHYVMNEDAPSSFAYRIDGSGDWQLDRFTYSPFVQLGWWDESGRVVDIGVEAFELRSEWNQARELHIPAGMVFALSLSSD